MKLTRASSVLGPLLLALRLPAAQVAMYSNLQVNPPQRFELCFEMKEQKLAMEDLSTPPKERKNFVAARWQRSEGGAGDYRIIEYAGYEEYLADNSAYVNSRGTFGDEYWSKKPQQLSVRHGQDMIFQTTHGSRNLRDLNQDRLTRFWNFGIPGLKAGTVRIAGDVIEVESLQGKTLTGNYESSSPTEAKVQLSFTSSGSLEYRSVMHFGKFGQKFPERVKVEQYIFGNRIKTVDFEVIEFTTPETPFTNESFQHHELALDKDRHVEVVISNGVKRLTLNGKEIKAAGGPVAPVHGQKLLRPAVYSFLLLLNVVFGIIVFLSIRRQRSNEA